MKLLLLDGNLIVVEKISFISKLDLTIEHNVQGGNKTYWFIIVIDGKDVKISANSQEKTNLLREELINALNVIS